MINYCDMIRDINTLVEVYTKDKSNNDNEYKNVLAQALCEKIYKLILDRNINYND